jgi:Fe-S-cluster containining protein
MRDGPIRRSLKRVALWNFTLNVRATRWIRRQRGGRPYLLGGECRRCARCCEAPAIQAGWLVASLPTLRAVLLFWQRAVNGFELTGREGDTFIFRCTHFDRSTRACDSYDSRPGMCRDYPRVLLDQPRPGFLPGCGFRPVAPNAPALRRALAALDLTPAQEKALARGLFLEE